MLRLEDLSQTHEVIYVFRGRISISVIFITKVYASNTAVHVLIETLEGYRKGQRQRGRGFNPISTKANEGNVPC